MLKTINLTKHFNGQTVVKDLNLTIDSGEIYCLLGANGAGKTTTINMLLNVFSTHVRESPDWRSFGNRSTRSDQKNASPTFPRI